MADVERDTFIFSSRSSGSPSGEIPQDVKDKVDRQVAQLTEQSRSIKTLTGERTLLAGDVPALREALTEAYSGTNASIDVDLKIAHTDSKVPGFHVATIDVTPKNIDALIDSLGKAIESGKIHKMNILGAYHEDELTPASASQLALGMRTTLEDNIRSVARASAPSR